MSIVSPAISVTTGTYNIALPTTSLSTIIGVAVQNIGTAAGTFKAGTISFPIGPQTTSMIPMGGGITDASLIVYDGTSSLVCTWFMTGEPFPSAPTISSVNTGVTTISAGTVDIGTIQAGQVIEVINSPSTQITTQSVASNTSITLNGPGGGGTVSGNISVPTSPTMHSALVSGVWSVASANLTVKITGNNTSALYYYYESGLSVASGALQTQTIPVSSADTDLVVTLIAGATGAATTVYANFYSQAIPPDLGVYNNLDFGLFDTQGYTDPQFRTPYLSTLVSDINTLSYSTHNAILLSDSVAPADSGGSFSYSPWPTTATTIMTPTVPVILRTVSGNFSAACTINVIVNSSSVQEGCFASTGTNQVIPSATLGWYVPANTAVQAFSDQASIAGNLFLTWTTL